MILTLALGACGSGSTSSQTSSAATPEPLISCESRTLTLDGIDLELDANVDGTLAEIAVTTQSPPETDREKAVADAKKLFGDPHPDPRTTTRPWRLGLIRKTDMCGRPLVPEATPSPA